MNLKILNDTIISFKIKKNIFLLAVVMNIVLCLVNHQFGLIRNNGFS